MRSEKKTPPRNGNMGTWDDEAATNAAWTGATCIRVNPLEGSTDTRRPSTRADINIRCIWDAALIFINFHMPKHRQAVGTLPARRLLGRPPVRYAANADQRHTNPISL